jgi:hypothetical protein
VSVAAGGEEKRVKLGNTLSDKNSILRTGNDLEDDGRRQQGLYHGE